MGSIFSDLGYEVDTKALEDLIVGFFQWIITFDPKTINVEYLSQLLTTFAPIWNPIWKAIGEFLGTEFGF
jgi:hypothetical protein